MNLSYRMGVLSALTSALILVTTVSGRGDSGIVAVAVPASAEAGMYSLASDGRGGALLSWLEPSAAGLALKFSRLANRTWDAPTTIVEGRHLFSNWADHPSIAAQADGTLVAQWPVINDGPQPPGSYNNSMRMARSTDRGASWTEVFADGLDNTHSYTGFVSIADTPAGARAVYLSPPRPIVHSAADHRMTLSHVALDTSGKRVSHGVIDSDACSCCPTAVASAAAGAIAAYRDHEPGEVRDIAIVRFVDGAWTAPRPVHRDGWVINGCPTNGPAIGASGARVAVAWFTAANDQPRIKVAFSTDSGASFAAPIVLDDTHAVGRPAALMLADGSAVVTWLASAGHGSSELHLRRVRASEGPGPVVVAGAAAPGRTSGMPHMVQVGDSLLLAWRGERLQTALVPMPAQ